MRKLVLKMSMSIDGFVGGPSGELDFLRGLDAPASEWLVQKLWEADVHIMGRPTFEVMSAYWPTSSAPFAPPMNDIPKIYFSKATSKASIQVDVRRDASPQLKSWIEAKLATGNLAEEIASLKSQPGKAILAHGGAGFGRSLVENGLVDEFQLVVHPVAIGKGLMLFESLPRPTLLKLISSSAFPGGVIANIYHVAQAGLMTRVLRSAPKLLALQGQSVLCQAALGRLFVTAFFGGAVATLPTRN